MSGFTIYETLRILVPGALALVILDLVVRLATGTGVLTLGAGEPATFIDFIEQAGTFAILTLVRGSVLVSVGFSREGTDHQRESAT